MEIIKEIEKTRNRKRAEVSKSFFKTGKGEYGEGDVFVGSSVPELRKIAKKFYKDISLAGIKVLLGNKVHEVRLAALFILVQQYEKGNDKQREKIVKFYLKNTKGINNWDLVDSSSYKILGNFLIDKDRSVLYKLAESKNMWERRIAMVSAFALIRENDLEDTYKLAEKLLFEEHDLMHKAVGWMLREAGKHDEGKLKAFLYEYGATMPRTTLRYAIEKFTKSERQEFMNLKYIRVS